MKLSVVLLGLIFLTAQSVEAQGQERQNQRNQVSLQQNDQPIPPPKPNVKAVVGDGMVTLYWDEAAESHYDPFFDGYVLFEQDLAPPDLPVVDIRPTFANPNNFQGYKIYKSTDPEFRDALRITDNRGNPIGFRHEILFDLPNEITGYHPASISGQRIELGNDVGIRRFWQDTGLVNGRTYYYAVVSFTHGDAIPEFTLPVVDEQGDLIDPPPLPSSIYTHPPLDSGMDIEILEDGTVITGVNVIKVVPQKGAAGYMPPADPQMNRISGSGRGTVDVQIVDPFRLKSGNSYSIVFQDTLVDGVVTGTKDLVTKNFSFINTTTGEIIFDEVDDFGDVPLPIVDGLQLTIGGVASRVTPDMELSEWVTSQQSSIHNLVFGLSGNPAPSDYRIEFFDEPVRESTPFTITSGGSTLNLPAENVNFIVYNTITGEEIDFAFFTNPQLPRDLRSVAMLNESTVVISGAAGLVQRSTDGGETWEVAETGQTVRLNSLYFVDEQTGWAAGRQGVVLKTTDGGLTWSEAQDTGLSDVILRDVFFIDENTGFASGDGGTMIKTTDGGNSWSTVNTGVNRRINKVHFTDENNGWAVGLLTTIRTTDGGETWQSVSTGVNVEFFGAHFSDANTGWLVGTNGTIVKTTDGGALWENQSDAAYRTLNDIKFLDNNTGWAVGRNGSVIFTNDGGTTWTIQASGTEGELFSISPYDADKAVIVGTNSIRIRTTDGGANWLRTEDFRRFRAAFDDNNQPRSDAIYFLESLEFVDDTGLTDTWRVSMLPRTATSDFGLTVDPAEGDELRLFTVKPFTAADEFRFTIEPENLPTIDDEIRKDEMRNINVVPNPYLVTHIAEPAGQRQLHFVNLPQQCTIRIFSVSGRLLQTLHVDNPVNEGRYVWNMRTSNNYDLPYGVYIYHVSAPGVGEKVGKFAVIK